MLNADLVYSFRRIVAILPSVPGPIEVLVKIEKLLVSAAQAYRERRYEDAIEEYTAARKLIWSQLAPVAPFNDLKLREEDLTASLTSFSAEWLNLLPVEQSVVGVRPRVEPNVEIGEMTGLFSDALNRESSQAAADLQSAQALASVGNKSADFFHARAMAGDPDLVRFVEEQQVDLQSRFVIPPRERQEMDLRGLRVGHLINAPAVSFRRLDVFTETPVVKIPHQLTSSQRFYAVKVGDDLQRLSWNEGDTLQIGDLLDTVYEARRKLKVLPDVLINPQRGADVAVGLTHAWAYETPLGLAESYHALGSYARAASWYVVAANYRFINEPVEAPYVWTRLANCYLDWGNSLFRSGEPELALPVYENVLTSEGVTPDQSPLHTIAGLLPAKTMADDVIAHLGDPDGISDVTIPGIRGVIFEVWAQLSKIAGGLDYWGHWAANVPIWTFDYLHSVTTTFAQLAIGAERDAISFWEKADNGKLTRTQIAQNVAVSEAERAAVQQQVEAAEAELVSYKAGVATAQLRATNARANAAEYATKSRSWTMHQALSAQLTGGEDGDADELNRLADRMIQGGYSIRGDRGTLSAAESLTAARLQREYEVHAMQRQAQELDAVVAQAGRERDAAAARVKATKASAQAASVRVAAAQRLLAAFDDQRFTPDVWNAMGEGMSRLADRYLIMALDVAKRMQRAYNFENDVKLTLIKPDYTAQSVNGLLAADALLADIQTFTYEMITSTAPSPQPIKQTISLAQRYPFLFETQLRRTGRMEFQTGVDDFDEVYPGTYAGRIVAVDVEVEGIVPPRGISGTLTNSGISHYRVPSDLWAPETSGVKHRVQNRESLVISDYDTTTDALVVTTDRRRRGVFEGAGVASSWTLDLPPEANDLDYAAVFDVRLTFTYQARFDLDLKPRVLAELAAAPSARERQRPLPLRWLFPDAFFAFYSTGTLAIAIQRSDFKSTEKDPKLTGLGLVVATTPSTRAEGIVLRVGVAGGTPVQVTCTPEGAVDSEVLTAALEAAGEDAAIGGSAFGDYTVEVHEDDNPELVVDGALNLDAIDNIALVLGYSYTPGV